MLAVNKKQEAAETRNDETTKQQAIQSTIDKLKGKLSEIGTYEEKKKKADAEYNRLLKMNIPEVE